MFKLYIAAPLFTPAERDQAENLANAVCKIGYEAYVPHKEGFLVQDLISAYEKKFKDISKKSGLKIGYNPEREANHFVFCIDVAHLLQECSGLIFSMNGRVPDEGAIAEATMAWMLGLPVFTFKEDSRTLLLNLDNPLIYFLGHNNPINNIDDLARYIASNHNALLAAEDGKKLRLSMLPYQVSQSLELGNKYIAVINKYGDKYALDNLISSCFDVKLLNSHLTSDLRLINKQSESVDSV